MSPEAQARIIHLRQKQLQEPLSLDELKEAIKLMREDRVGAAASSATSKARKAGTKVLLNPDDLLKGLADF